MPYDLTEDDLDLTGFQQPQVRDLTEDDLDLTQLGKPQPPPPPKPKQKVPKPPRKPVAVQPIYQNLPPDPLAGLGQSTFMKPRPLTPSENYQRLTQLENDLKMKQAAENQLVREEEFARMQRLDKRVKKPERPLEIKKFSTSSVLAKRAKGEKLNLRESLREQELLMPPKMREPQPPSLDPTTLGESLIEAPLVAREIGRSFVRPAATMFTELPRGAGATMDLINQANPFVRDEFQGTMERSLAPVSDVATGAVERAIPLDPTYNQSFFVRGVPGALGSAAGFAAGGIAGKSLGIPAALTTAGLGAVVNVADIAREADRMGIARDRRNGALLMAAGAGLTEAFGLGRALDKFGLSQTFTRRLIDIAEEGGQEALQQWLNNLNAVLVGKYDPNRPLTRDVLENALLGSIVGGTFQGASALREKFAFDKSNAEFKQRFEEDYGISDPDQIKVHNLGPKRPPPPRPPARAVPGTPVDRTADPVGYRRVGGDPRKPVDISALQTRTAELDRERQFLEIGVDQAVSRMMDPSDDIRQQAAAYIMGSLYNRLREISQESDDIKLAIYEQGGGELTFDVMPALQPGQAPYLRTPAWAMRALAGRETTKGYNIPIEDHSYLVDKIMQLAPSPQHASAALTALWQLAESSKEEGINSFSLIESAAPESEIQERAEHETYHAGQRMALTPDPLWAGAHPAVQKVLANPDVLSRIINPSNPPSATVRLVGIEIPAYHLNGRDEDLGLTPEEGEQYTNDYYKYILTNVGPEGLATLKRTARMRPDVVAAIDAAEKDFMGEGERVFVEGWGWMPPGLASEAMPKGPFYSGMAEVIRQRFPDKMTPEQAMSMLLDPKYGIKRDEYDWTNIDTLIARSAVAGNPITKENLINWVESNQIRVGERLKGQGLTQENNLVADELADLTVESDRLRQEIETSARSLQQREDYGSDAYVQAADDLQALRDKHYRIQESIEELEREVNRDPATPQYQGYRAIKEGAKPGSYRELLITLPLRGPSVKRRRLAPMIEGTEADFYSSHFEEPNVIVHVRFDQGWDTDGNPILRIQEIQSDWHQQGREKGYRSLDAVENERLKTQIQEAIAVRKEIFNKLEQQLDADPSLYESDNESRTDALKRNFPELWAEHQAADEKVQSLLKQVGEIPDGPFKNNWHDLAFKRMIRWAADNGYKKLVWTTAAQQIDLYAHDQMQNVTSITLHPNFHTSDQPYVLQGVRRGSGTVVNEEVDKEELYHLVGKEVGDKLTEQFDNNQQKMYPDGLFDWGFAEVHIRKRNPDGGARYDVYGPNNEVIPVDVEGGVYQAQLRAKAEYESRYGNTDGFFAKIEGNDLSIGGQMHKLLYDKKLPQLARDYVKKYGGTSGTTNIYSQKFWDTKFNETDPDDVVPWEVRDQYGNYGGNFEKEDVAKNEADRRNSNAPKVTVHYMDVSPVMKATAQDQGFRLMTVEDPGTLVKVKGYKSTARVVGPGSEPGLIQVRFPMGTLDEFEMDDLSEITPPKQPTPRTPIMDELARQPIVRDAETLQQELPGMEGARPSKIAEPPIMPPIQPPLPGMGPEMPEMFQETVTLDYTKPIVKAYIRLLEQGGVKFNPNIRVFYQVVDALGSGKISGKDFDQALAENGLTLEQFQEEFKHTVSEAARTLQQLSRVKLKYAQLVKKNQKLAEKLQNPKELFDALLEEINQTIVGRNGWQRASAAIRMLMLSDLRTAVVNSWVTVGRIPLSIASHGAGAWMYHAAQARNRGETLADAVKRANSKALEAMQIGTEILTSVINPKDLVGAITKEGGKHMYYQEVIDQLTEAFPDLHYRLMQPGIGPDEPTKLKDQFNVAKALIAEMKGEETRTNTLDQIRTLERRLNFNNNNIFGKAMRGGEVFLDWTLAPMRWQERLFRRPMFVAYLNYALNQRGMKLQDMIRLRELGAIPEDILSDAIDEALDFTYAYMPHEDGNWAERAAYHFITGINQTQGIGALMGVAFPRAMYNGMKFLYEYSPLGAYPYFAKKLRPRDVTDPISGNKRRMNPLTEKDYRRLGKAMIGTVMFTAAMSLIKAGMIGDEWWQLKLPFANKYFDIRRFQPFSTFMKLADISMRTLGTITNSDAFTRRLGDFELGKELKEAITGFKSFPGGEEAITAFLEMWDDPDSSTLDKAMVSGGMGLSWITRPLVNIRDAVAIFSDEEQEKKDLKGTSVWGPIVDNVPWLRSYMLEDATSPTQAPPVENMVAPATSFVTGGRIVEGENFAGREWRRLGIRTSAFLPPDPDPIINRAQNKYFFKLIEPIAKALENSPAYQQGDDKKKLMMWEMFVSDDQGIAATAKDMGEMANPKEAIKRELKAGSGMGRFMRDSTGFDKKIRESSDNQK